MRRFHFGLSGFHFSFALIHHLFALSFDSVEFGLLFRCQRSKHFCRHKLTHFLRIIRAIMLKGADLSDIDDEVIYLSLFVPVYAGLALMRFRSTLD